jgi:hypothetical protein
MFHRGDVIETVGEKNSLYDISLKIPGMDVPKIVFSNIVAKGNTVAGTARTDLLRGGEIPFSFTFAENTARGVIKVPFLGKIALNNGIKIA